MKRINNGIFIDIEEINKKFKRYFKRKKYIVEERQNTKKEDSISLEIDKYFETTQRVKNHLSDLYNKER